MKQKYEKQGNTVRSSKWGKRFFSYNLINYCQNINRLESTLRFIEFAVKAPTAGK